MGIFSGLESFGLSKLKNVDIYEKAAEDKKKEETEKKEKPKVREVDILFDKTYTCPVCDNEFKAKTVRTGKVKLMSADTDLRPRYQLVDALKYDAIVCPKCGYAALNRFFTYMTSGQSRLIREQISTQFNGISDSGEIYSYDDAIARHKLALINTIVKRGKTSERAYTCLKLAWLYRGKAENLPQNTKDLEVVLAQLKKEEDELIKNAYEGFSTSFSKEQFPMCGMDEHTATYLVADLARRSGNPEDAKRLISRIITSRQANDRIKAKARELKDLIREMEEDQA
ncbi:MAG: uncharacterized protein PWP24_189 [Clostridiales bacterium]|nr:uncharacterized protein [Clostridiales bacterium]